MKLIFLALAFLASSTRAALPSPDYLPPSSQDAAVRTDDPQSPGDSSFLADDGYQYRTVKRYRHRHRRDVSELPAISYLPPASAAPFVADIPVAVEVRSQEQDSAVLADDGYHYKTVKRFRLRHRRDVAEVSHANDYLPPSDGDSVDSAAPEQAAAVAKQATNLSVDEPVEDQETAVLGDDGYQYKTVKRLKVRRQRRDVNEVQPDTAYLPPSEEGSGDAAQQVSVLPAAPSAPSALPDDKPSENQDSAVLAKDGYQYRTVKRYRLRHRRDVNELPASEYLPPADGASVAPETSDGVSVLLADDASTRSEDSSSVLADDGYRYKTVKRVVYRNRL